EDKRMQRKVDFLADLAVSMGGYVAETEIFGKDNLTTGPSDDLRRATRMARRLLTDFAMSEKLGTRTYGEKEEMVFLGREIHHERDYSEKVAEQIDAEIERILGDARETARKIITENREKMDKIVAVLLEKETIEKEEFEEVMGSKHPSEKAAPAAA